MKTAVFKDWDLTSLDKAFGLKQIWKSELLSNWEKMPIEIGEFEKRRLAHVASIAYTRR